MNYSRALRQARRAAGLTQRQLATLTGLKQPAIARIESGAVIPRVDTLDMLLKACGEALESVPRLGRGVDRTMMRELLKLHPGERARIAVRDARNIDEIRITKI